jgi:hypothetical protein
MKCRAERRLTDWSPIPTGNLRSDWLIATGKIDSSKRVCIDESAACWRHPVHSCRPVAGALVPPMAFGSRLSNRASHSRCQARCHLGRQRRANGFAWTSGQHVMTSVLAASRYLAIGPVRKKSYRSCHR